MSIDKSRLWCLCKVFWTMTVVAALTACAPKPPLVAFSTNTPPLVLAPASKTGGVDGRGRFREIFCAVTDERGQDMPDYRPCDDAIVKLAGEPPETGQPVSLGQSELKLRIAIVPGLGWDCFENIVDPQGTVLDHVGQFGYQATVLRVDALSSSSNNAKQIRDAVMGMSDVEGEKNLVLLGYSKGTPDVLEAIVSYPELQDRVVGVITIAGAVGGSPLAYDATQSMVNLLQHIPGSECDKGDEGALNSLRPDTRQRWLAEHQLPESVRYYSLVAYPDRERVSAGLRGSYDKLSQIDGRNDSQMLFYDQVIPGSVLLGYLNADHWAVFVPIARNSPLLGSTFINQNAFPREIMLEAVARFVEEDLAQRKQ